MRPTKQNYDESIMAINKFMQKFPAFDSRGDYAIASKECAIAGSINCLDFTAGMWACGDKTHYSITEYRAALNLINAEIGDYEYVWPPSSPRPAGVDHLKFPSPDNHKARRKAARAERYANDPVFRARCDSYR